MAVEQNNPFDRDLQQLNQQQEQNEQNELFNIFHRLDWMRKWLKDGKGELT